MGSKGNKDQVLAIIPSLTKEELQVVSELLTSLLDDDGSNAVAELWFDACKQVLGSCVAFAILSKGSMGKQLRKNVVEAEQFLTTLLPNKRRIDYAVARRLLISLLADDLKRRKANVTIGSLVLNLPRLTEVFDTSFPLYRNSGLAHLVFGGNRGKEPA